MLEFRGVPIVICSIAFAMALLQVLVEMYFDVDDDMPSLRTKDKDDWRQD